VTYGPKDSSHTAQFFIGKDCHGYFRAYVKGFAMFEYSRVKTDDCSLQQYASLLRNCFPSAAHLTSRYLRWLYVENPCGTAVGIDAFCGEVLAAHYVCVPSDVSIMGRQVKALLSLNTATHPEFRGKGLFTKLADATYGLAAELGYSLVYGVANANSTPGFVRKLGFQLVGPLDATLGLGRQFKIDWEKVHKVSEFRCLWDTKRLSWRIRNPENRIAAVTRESGISELFARTDKKNIVAWAEVPTSLRKCDTATPSIVYPRLFLGLNPRDCAAGKIRVSIPNRLRPSPLNFIVRSVEGEVTLDRNLITFSFADFDAY